MADEIIDQLDDVKAKLLGLTHRFEQMHSSLKSKIEEPEVKKYIQQNSSIKESAMSEFFVIAAACKNNGIGFMNRLPWKLKNEMAYFNRMTTADSTESHKSIVIMGRKTWSSIPPKYRPLEGRTNVVLSRTVSTVEDRDLTSHIFYSLPAALKGISIRTDKGQVWVIGGQSVYEEALKLPQCRRIYLTRIDKEYECDTFFPEIDESVYKLTSDPNVPEEEQVEEGIHYKYTVYERI